MAELAANVDHEDVPLLGVQHFRYRAIDRATGKRTSGEQSGPSAFAVRSALRQLGLEVVAIEPLRHGDDQRWPSWLRPLQRFLQARRRQARRAARADIADALATMLEAGLPLDRSLHELAAAPTRGKSEREMLRHLRDHVRAGSSLAEACSLRPDWFDAVDGAMIAAGQHAGELSQVLHSLSTYHQDQAQLGGRLLAALAYPGFLLLATLAVVVFLSQYTLPELIAILENGDLSVPTLTTAVIAIGDSLVHAWPLWLLVIVLIIWGLRETVARLPVDGRLARLLAANPISRLQRRSRMASCCHTLARLLGCGIPLTDSLRLTADTLANRDAAATLRASAEAIHDGAAFSDLAANSHLFDPEVAQFIRLGEQSGELAAMFERSALRYRRASERGLSTLSAMLEPLALVFMAALIGIVIMAAVLPIMRLGDLVA